MVCLGVMVALILTTIWGQIQLTSGNNDNSSRTKRELSSENPKREGPCLKIKVNYNTPNTVVFDVCQVIACGAHSGWYRAANVYGCLWIGNVWSTLGAPERRMAFCPEWRFAFTHTDTRYKTYYEPKYLTTKTIWAKAEKFDKPMPYFNLSKSSGNLVLHIPKLGDFHGVQEQFNFTLGVDQPGKDSLGLICIYKKTENRIEQHQAREEQEEKRRVAIINTDTMTWRDQLAIETGYDDSNTWLDWIKYTADGLKVSNCFICAAAKPNLATHPVRTGNLSCLVSLFTPPSMKNTAKCRELTLMYPKSEQQVPSNIRAYKGNHTCFSSSESGISRGNFPENWCSDIIQISLTNATFYNQTTARADLLWLCGDMKVRKRLSGVWNGQCALVYLIMPFRIYRQEGVEDPADVMRHHRQTREVKPGGSFDKTVWIDGIGVPRGVPDEFKARNQIAAGFESIFFWWSTINKNVDWINYLYYNQQRFVNFTIQAVEGLRDQLDKTSLMTIQNRMALDMLLADKGGVCHMIGSTCCTFIPNNTAPDGTVSQALEGLKALSKEWKENSGIDNPFTKWMEQFFGSWKGVITQLAMSICVGLAILMVCGCCCIPCIRALIVKFIHTVVQKGQSAGGSDQEIILLMQAHEEVKDQANEEYWA